MKLKFMDFCSGIGAARVALESIGMDCVAYSEINEKSVSTYNSFFGNNHKNYGNLMDINSYDLPDFDLLVAGFPCQTFSIVGKRSGFEDDRGQIIYGLLKILKERDIKYFILENVKGLVNFQSGYALQHILELFHEANYTVRYRVLDSINYGVPQMRERIYFVGVKNSIPNNLENLKYTNNKIKDKTLDAILINEDKKFEFNENTSGYGTFLSYLENKYNRGKFIISELLSNEYLVLDTRQSDLRLYRDRVPTLRTGRHGILYVRDKKFRRLSGEEALLLQGYPKKLAKKAQSTFDNTSLLSQAGNAMTVNVIKHLGNELMKALEKKEILKVS